MRPEELHDRMLKFGNAVILMTDTLPETFSARHTSRQLIRSATSVGANYAEAQAAESKADFIHKLHLALKECRESHSWLKLLFIRYAGNITDLANLLNESSQLLAILSKALLTAKSRP